MSEMLPLYGLACLGALVIAGIGIGYVAGVHTMEAHATKLRRRNEALEELQKSAGHLADKFDRYSIMEYVRAEIEWNRLK